MSNPYSDKPSTVSDPDTWHEISFQISVDVGVDWDEVDLRKWAHTVAKYTGLVMAQSNMSEAERKKAADETIKTLLMNVSVKRVNYVSDDELHNMIDEFDDEAGE